MKPYYRFQLQNKRVRCNTRRPKMELSQIDRAGPSGCTLNIEERAGLEAAMLKRKLEEGLDKMYFWGKVFGIESDYLIVFAIVPSDDFPAKKFYFWCVAASLWNSAKESLARSLVRWPTTWLNTQPTRSPYHCMLDTPK